MIAYVGLGANLGDPLATLRAAILALSERPGMKLLGQSAFYRSTPVDAGGDDYINAVVQVETVLSPLSLLHTLMDVERAAGRERPYRNAPRTLDLDLLLFGNETVDLPDLQVPHPRMWERAFVLQPLAEIAPALVAGHQLERVAHQGVWRVE